MCLKLLGLMASMIVEVPLGLLLMRLQAMGDLTPLGPVSPPAQVRASLCKVYIGTSILERSIPLDAGLPYWESLHRKEVTKEASLQGWGQSTKGVR